MDDSANELLYFLVCYSRDSNGYYYKYELLCGCLTIFTLRDATIPLVWRGEFGVIVLRRGEASLFAWCHRNVCV